MINELARFPTRSDNVYFANNEQASIPVFTAVFCFTHADHHLIKLKLHNNWSAQAVNIVLCEIQRNQLNLLIFKNYPIFCTENQIFFFQTPWKDGISKKSRWNMIFLLLSRKIIFIFPENMILALRRKMKDDLLKKIDGNMISSSNVLKRWSFQKGPH